MLQIIQRYGNLRNKLSKFFMELGVVLLPLGHTVYLISSFFIIYEQFLKNIGYYFRSIGYVLT